MVILLVVTILVSPPGCHADIYINEEEDDGSCSFAYDFFLIILIPI